MIKEQQHLSRQVDVVSLNIVNWGSCFIDYAKLHRNAILNVLFLLKEEAKLRVCKVLNYSHHPLLDPSMNADQQLQHLIQQHQAKLFGVPDDIGVHDRVEKSFIAGEISVP